MIGGAPSLFTIYIIIEVVLAAAVLIYEFGIRRRKNKKNT